MALTNKLTAIADAIRAKTGKTDALTLDAMVTEIGSISGGGTGLLVFDDEYNLTGSITEIPTKFIGGTSSIPTTNIGKLIKEVNFEKVESVDSYAFANTSVSSVNLPLCTTLNDYAFSTCTELTSVNLPLCTSIGKQAFNACVKLTNVDLPACEKVQDTAFFSCTGLTSINLPNATTFGSSAFSSCSSLTSINLPNATTFGSSAFQNCSAITRITLPKVTNLGGQSLCQLCSSLTAFVIENEEQVASLTSTNYAFASTPIKTGTGYIYVPDALVDSYKTATNWSTFANQIKPLSELPDE